MILKRSWAASAAILIGVAAGAFGAARPAIGATGTVTVSGYVCTIVGTPGNDVLHGTPGPDVICGLGGNDVLIGDGGNDVLLGGPGRDALLGGLGSDVLLGGAGPDRLDGGFGNDLASWIDHFVGVDVSLDGLANDGAPGEGDSVGDAVEGLVGGPAADVLVGNDKPNKIKGGDGRDVIKGKGGNDSLDGGNGDNTIDGGDGADAVTCGPGKTMIIPGLGDVKGINCKKVLVNLPRFTGTVAAIDPETSTLTISPGSVALEPWVASPAANSWIQAFAPKVAGAPFVTFKDRKSTRLNSSHRT